MGMTYDQFWDGDISAHKQYREAEKLKIKEKNQFAWIQGMYFYEALCDVAPAIKAFSKAKPQKYRDEPYDLFDEERKRRAEREQRERYERIKQRVAAFAKAFNEKKNSERNEVESNAGCFS